MKDFFMEIKKNGKLYTDRIFFESYYPILFSCKNEIGEHFICVCCQNNKDGKKWLIGKTEVHNIIKLLKNEITIRDLLLNYTSSKISIDKTNSGSKIDYNNDDWMTDSIYLPKEDSYLDPDNGEFDDDIEYYAQERIKKQYSSNVFKNIIQKEVKNDGIKLEVDHLEFSFTAGTEIRSEVLKNYKEIVDISITAMKSIKIEYKRNVKANNNLKPYEVKIQPDKLQADKMQIDITLSSFSKAA